MKGIGEGIAFAGLCVSATWAEINGLPTVGLWIIVVLWASTTDWGQKDKDS